MELDMSGLDAALDAFKDRVTEHVTRAGAQAAAQAFYDEARARVPVSAHAHYFYGTSFKKTGQRYFFNAGTLKNAIYQVFSKDNSTDKIKTYHVAWNHQKAPYGFMVEFGTSRAPAHPFLRPAYEAVKVRAGQIALDRMRAELAK